MKTFQVIVGMLALVVVMTPGVTRAEHETEAYASAGLVLPPGPRQKKTHCMTDLGTLGGPPCLSVDGRQGNLRTSPFSDHVHSP